MTTTVASEISDNRTRVRMKLVVAATVFGILLNWGLEVTESVLVSEGYAALDNSLAKNLVVVALWSLAGMVVAIGLVRLGAGSRRMSVAWAAGALALLTVLPFFYVAIPASLAGAAYTLTDGRAGSGAAVRVLAVIAFLAFVVVSVGMFPFAEV